jgi:selenide,water dikinase
MSEVKLTQYSPAAGCGCKIDANLLKRILSGSPDTFKDKNLFVGNDNNEDSAAYEIDENNFLLSTIDFFTPVVDDAYEYGYIAAANALSDIFAMGGKPLFALSVLAWPVKELPEAVSAKVIHGAKDACANAGIVIAGGHSIENKEPVFGLAVNGIVKKENIKLNRGAKPGDLIFLTKPLGAGILTTAIKRNLIKPEDYEALLKNLRKINSTGIDLGKVKGVHAMTDVTGFGLAGHLGEMCLASEVSAKINFKNLRFLTDMKPYIEADSLPGGLHKNWRNYSGYFNEGAVKYKEFLADPQTNGGLLVSVDPESINEVKEIFLNNGEVWNEPIGEIVEKSDQLLRCE